MRPGLCDERSTHPAALAHNHVRFHLAASYFPMLLTDEQTQKVAEWIEAGAKLSEIQDRLGNEFGVRMTYMDARMLVDDLKLTPKEAAEPEKPVPDAADGPGPGAQPPGVPGEAGLAVEPPAAGGRVNVSVDQITRPGAMVSGKVTFSDGQSAEWYMDQTGRLGLVAAQPGYRPPEADVAEFQVALDRELVKLGM